MKEVAQNKLFAIDNKERLGIIILGVTTMEKRTSAPTKANHLATFRNKVIQLIRQEQVTDRNSISSALDINVSTSKRIVDDLVEEKIVRLLGSAKSTGGRKATNIGINPDYGWNICIKVEVNSLIFALTDFLDQVVSEERVPFSKGASFDEVKPLIKKEILDLMVYANAKGKNIRGIGFAISGLASKDAKRLVVSRLLGWSNINFDREFGSELRIPVFVEHDVNCAAIAEQWFGQGKDLSTFLLVTIGEGTGAGIIINKKLYKGSFGGAGEIGHVIFQKDGLPCYCGQKGCLEMYTNEHFLYSSLKALHPELSSLTPETLQALLKQDPHGVQKILNDYAANLATGLIGAVMLIEPEKIIIGGELSYVFNYTKDVIQGIFNENWINQVNDEEHRVGIVRSTLGSASFIKGLSVLLVSRALYH